MSRSGASYLTPGQTFGPVEWVPGSYYGPITRTALSSSTGWTNGLMEFSPLAVPSGGATIDRLAIQLQGSSGAGGLVRLGLYASLANGRPGALVVDGGTIDATQAAGFYAVTVAPAITPGPYWLALVVQGTPSPMPGLYYANPALSVVGFATWSVTERWNGYASTATTFSGALPDPAPTALTPQQFSAIAYARAA